MNGFECSAAIIASKKNISDWRVSISFASALLFFLSIQCKHQYLTRISKSSFLLSPFQALLLQLSFFFIQRILHSDMQWHASSYFTLSSSPLNPLPSFPPFILLSIYLSPGVLKMICTCFFTYLEFLSDSSNSFYRCHGGGLGFQMRMMHSFISQPRSALGGFSASQHKTNYLYILRENERTSKWAMWGQPKQWACTVPLKIS